MAIRLGFNTKKYFQAILISFLVIQAGSFLLHTIYNMPLLKMGWLLMLSLVIILITTLYTLGINFNQLNKKSLIFVGIVFIGVIALMFFIPKLVPEIFSIQYSELIKSSINSIVGG